MNLPPLRSTILPMPKTLPHEDTQTRARTHIASSSKTMTIIRRSLMVEGVVQGGAGIAVEQCFHLT